MHTSGYRRNHHRHEVGWHVKDRDSGNRHLDDGGAVTLYDVPKFKGRENHGEAKAHGRRLSAGLAEPSDLKLRFLTDADTRKGLVAVRRRTELTFPIRASSRKHPMSGSEATMFASYAGNAPGRLENVRT